MCCKSMRYPREALMAITPRDSVSWIMYGGSKVQKCVDLIGKEPKDSLIKKFGQKVFDRAFETKQRLDSGRAILMRKSAVELELVQLVDGKPVLTHKGELELLAHARYGLEAKHLLEKCDEPRILIQKLRFAPRPTFGLELFKAAQHQVTDLGKINAVIHCLEGRMEPKELQDEMDELQKWAVQNYPIKDQFKDTLFEAYLSLQNKVLDSEESDDDSPEIPEADPERSVRDELIGPHSVSQDPNDRKLSFIGELEQMRDQIATVMTSKISGTGYVEIENHGKSDDVWKLISRIIDHYSGSDFSVEYVYLGPRSDEARIEREDFPYDPVTYSEPVFKVDTKARDIPESIREILLAAHVIKPNQVKMITTRTAPVCGKRGKPIATVHHLENDGDFELEHHFEKVDGEREWKRRILLALTHPNSCRLPSSNAGTIDRATMLKYKARYIAKYPDKDDKSFGWFLSKGLLGDIGPQEIPAVPASFGTPMGYAISLGLNPDKLDFRHIDSWFKVSHAGDARIVITQAQIDKLEAEIASNEAKLVCNT